MLALLITTFGGLAAIHSSAVQDIIITEAPPRPARFEIAPRASCGSKTYDIAVENFGGIDSRLIRATANGAPISFRSRMHGANLAQAVEGKGVTSLIPIACDSETGEIVLKVEAYEPAQDAQPGQDAHAVLLFSSADQADQRPPVPTPHYQVPSAISLNERYTCFGEVIRLSLQVSGSSIVVSDYVRGELRATRDELARWNSRLGRLGEFGHLRFSCASGGRQAISVHGAERSRLPHTKAILAQWSPEGLRLNDVSEPTPGA